MRHVILILILTLVCFGCASESKWKRQEFAFTEPADPPTTGETGRTVELDHVSISPIFQSRSFTYRTGEDSYERDPYAGFLISPETELAESIRAWMRVSGDFGRVLDRGSGMTPKLIVEVSINELYGDFRNPTQPVARMGLHFTFCETQDGLPERVVFEKFCSQETPLARKAPAALMAAWDADLRKIMTELNPDYERTISRDHLRN